MHFLFIGSSEDHDIFTLEIEPQIGTVSKILKHGSLKLLTFHKSVAGYHWMLRLLCMLKNDFEYLFIYFERGKNLLF